MPSDSKVSSALSTHLTVLYKSAALFSSSTAFFIPQHDSSGTVCQWDRITYAQFLRDVERYAQLWRQKLTVDRIPERSVVGLWIPGSTYIDLLHIYGLSRAGYVPQLFSIRLPNSDVIIELLSKTEAKALIVDTDFSSIKSSCPIPTFCTSQFHETVPDNTLKPLPELFIPGPDDIIFIFHTSGSTSGSPKLVPSTATWLDSAVKKAAIAAGPVSSGPDADVAIWMGSMCHIGQSFMLMGFLQHGSSTIQPTQLAFSSQELQDMIRRCGLNHLIQFSTFMSMHFRNARSDPHLLAELQSLDALAFVGLPLSEEDTEWACQNGLKLSSMFGSTEVGLSMLSVHDGKGHDTTLLRPMPGTVYAFEPVESCSYMADRPLLEFVVRPESPDCPHVSLRQGDGSFHTGDLFIEVMPGCYSFCGRNDDWIKSENSLRCDARAIEENVRQECGDMLENCIVVGTGRPSPALFVEPASGIDPEHVRKEILLRTRMFHSRLYLHERITSPELVIMVPSKSLPRTATKGNIRRQAVEMAFKDQLDTIYRALAAGVVSDLAGANRNAE